MSQQPMSSSELSEGHQLPTELFGKSTAHLSRYPKDQQRPTEISGRSAAPYRDIRTIYK